MILRRFAPSVVLLLALTANVSRPAGTPPRGGVAWAYPVNPPAPPAPPAPGQGKRIRLPGATRSFTEAELNNLFAAPDWRPESHPLMPGIVALGRKPQVMACGYCHLPTGNGRPENASLAGLSTKYILAQLAAFRSGSRRSTVGGRAPTDLMETLARATTDAEIRDAAGYFAVLLHHRTVKVVEASMVPKTRISGWVYARDARGGVEPIAGRIIEIPVDFARFEARDPDARYVAYVPKGSIDRGATIARSWGNGQYACASCHGARLGGTAVAPPLAGRSPTYIVRQLNDFRSGARRGAASATMKPVVATMSEANMVALAAYVASR